MLVGESGGGLALVFRTLEDGEEQRNGQEVEQQFHAGGQAVGVAGAGWGLSTAGRVDAVWSLQPFGGSKPMAAELMQ
jgi:hypothetical protein